MQLDGTCDALRCEVSQLRTQLLEMTDKRLEEINRAEGEVNRLHDENQKLRGELSPARGIHFDSLRSLETKYEGMMQDLTDELHELHRRADRNEERIFRQVPTKSKENTNSDGSTVDRCASSNGELSVDSHDNQKELERIMDQNRELILTVQSLRQDSVLLEMENRSLRELATPFDEKLANKQKIHYIMQLKNENAQLRAELKTYHKRLLHFRANGRFESLVDALAPLAGFKPRGGPVVSAAPGLDALAEPRTPGRTLRDALEPRTPRTVHDAMPSCAGADLEPRVMLSERRCRQYERAFESIAIDFRHFIFLIELVLCMGGTGSAPGAVSNGGPGRQQSGKEDVQHLLNQLRETVANGVHGGDVGGRSQIGAKRSSACVD